MATANQEQINRIKTARDNIASVIRQKGVNTPENATLEDLIAYASAIEQGASISVILPTSTVTVIDNDYAADVKVTALVNEGGKLVYKSIDVPAGGEITFTYAWYTPIFITSKWIASISVEDAEGDLIRNVPNTYDATNNTFAVFPQIDRGDRHTVYVFQ